MDTVPPDWSALAKRRWESPEYRARQSAAHRSPDGDAARFWSKVDRSAGPEGCWPWLGARAPSGHGQFRVGGKTVYAYRFGWELANGPIADGMCILHRCDNGACVNPAHHFLGTRGDNLRDMYAKGRGRKARGGQHGRASMTDEQARLVQRIWKAGAATQAELAVLVGTTQTTISAICRGRTWKHLSNLTD